MDKASKALRRSGVRIRSIGSGHSDLQMVISQLKDVRLNAKGFAGAQNSAIQDLVKWSLKDENRAIQDAVTQVGELFSVWTEVQRDFSDQLKDFRHHFDMILEGSRQLDIAKTNLQAAEQKEGKLKKEIKKAAKKVTAEELGEMSVRLTEAEREKDYAQREVVDRVREHEAIKLIRIKEGLFKVAEAYIDLAQKCDILFSAQRDIALQIPDVTDRDIQDIKYTGSGATMLAVTRAKDRIKRFRRSSSCGHNTSCSRTEEDLPPPYSENPPTNPYYYEPPPGGVRGHTPDDPRMQQPRSMPPTAPDRSHPDNPFMDHQPWQAAGQPYSGSPLSSAHLAPVLPLLPHPGFPAPYQEATPPYDPLDHVTRRQPPHSRRRSSYSDAEDAATDAMSNLNISLSRK